MHMHPEAYIEMVDQDRERALTLRALQRAAREGGTQQPGMARGGIAGFAALLRSAAATFGRPSENRRHRPVPPDGSGSPVRRVTASTRFDRPGRLHPRSGLRWGRSGRSTCVSRERSAPGRWCGPVACGPPPCARALPG